jgi:CRP/FNR family transcriptional regulator
MADIQSPLSARLNSLWKGPDFLTFFGKYAKRPPLKLKKGATVFYQGDQPDKIYFIKKGYVKMFRVSESGRDSIIYLYGPGSLLGVRALTSKDEALRHDAEALTDAEIVTITRKDYLEILSQHPEYIVDLLHVFIGRLNYTERKLEGFVLTDTLSRVSNFLADCGNRFGVKKGKDIILPLPLTHQRIADFVGAFRETVTIAINKLEDEKIITVEKGVVTIHNMKKLEKKTQIHDNLED